MKIKDIKRLTITIVFVDQEALKIPEMWENAKILHPYLTQKEVFIEGLKKFLG